MLLAGANDFARRFWSHVAVGAPDECWPWLLSRASSGYGQVRHGQRIVRAHRVAWELANKTTVPSGLGVLHSCDNPPCCNPGHHFLGDAQANVDDMIAKGRRAPSLRGELSPNTDLNEAAIIEIRDRRAAGERGREIAEEFGLSEASVAQIYNRRTWAHVIGGAPPPTRIIRRHQPFRP